MQESREKLITENMKLVYYLIHRYYPTFSNDEDLEQIGMVGLCLAAERWDSTKSKFTTFASKVILNEIKQEFRRRNRQVNTLSLDAMNGGEGYEDKTLLDVLPGDPDVDYDPAEEFARKLTPKDRACFEALLSGCSANEIAKEAKCTPRNINKRTRIIRKIWEAEYGSID